ncbi:hypothetical protein MPSEU_000588600 [Mayamaea pseudoterrestris]|nr:hypothetical protein MPSEU_000588600 [Mayamaea pseudoterrestris]
MANTDSYHSTSPQSSKHEGSSQRQLDPLALLARVAEGSTNAQSPSNSNAAEETLQRLNQQQHSHTNTAAPTIHNGSLLPNKPLLLPPYLNRHTSGEHTETAASFGDESATTDTSGDSNINLSNCNSNNNHTATMMEEEEPVQREQQQQQEAETALPTSGVLARRNKRRQQREAREASARTKSHKTHSEHDTLRDVAPEEEEEQVMAAQAPMGMNVAAMQPRYLMQQGGHMMPLGTVTAATAPYSMLASNFGMQPFPQAYGSAMPFANDPSPFSYANAQAAAFRQAELQAAYAQQQQSAMMMAMAPSAAASSGVLGASMAGAHLQVQQQEERGNGEVPWYESGIVDDDSEMDLTILEAEPFTLFL